MGFRFRKSIKLFPGARLNFSKSGVNSSTGCSSVTINICKKGTRGTVGIPGTGVCYSVELTKNGHPLSLATAVQTSQLSEGMSMGALMRWGIHGLFGFLLVYGCVTG